MPAVDQEWTRKVEEAAQAASQPTPTPTPKKKPAAKKKSG